MRTFAMLPGPVFCDTVNASTARASLCVDRMHAETCKVAQLIHLVSDDIDNQAQSLTGFRQSYEQLGSGRFRGSMWQLMMNQGALFREQTNLSLRQHVVPPLEYVAFAIPIAVHPGSRFACRPLQCDSLMVLNSAEEYDIAITGTMDMVGMCIRRELIESLPPLEQEWFRHAQGERHIQLPSGAAADIRDMLLTTCASAEAALTNLDLEANARELLTSTIAKALFCATAQSETASQVPRRAENRQRIMKRAIEFMHAHMGEDIGLPEVCTAACASRRSLQYCFEEFLQTTPQAYLRAIRLNEARRLLKIDPRVSITVVANEFGFSGASHFARHYKAMFDELPSQTLRSSTNCASAGH